MDYQQMTLFGEQDVKRLRLYQGGSHANRIALQESARRLTMTVIYGRKCGELLARLSPDGLWLKTFQGYYQAKMDGSLEEFSGILPRWGLMLDGELRALPQLEPYIDESEWRLLPTPVASDFRGGCRRKNGMIQMSNLKEFLLIFCEKSMKTIYVNVPFLESLMGYPIGWTEVKRSETQ